MELVQITYHQAVAWARVPCLAGRRVSSGSTLCACPRGWGWHSQRTQLVVPNLLGDEKLVRCREKGQGGCHLLLACSVNQGTCSSGVATVTILPGAINQGRRACTTQLPMLPSSRPDPPHLQQCRAVSGPHQPCFCSPPLPCAATATQRGWLWSEVGAPRARWAEGHGGTWSLGLLHSTFGQEIHFAQRSSHGEWKGDRKDKACSRCLAAQSLTAQQGSISQVLRIHC